MPAPTSGLVLYYNMETLTGGQMEDLSDNTHHGTLHGTADIAGQVARARDFDGVDDYIDAVGGYTAIKDSHLATVAFWVWVDSYGAGGRLLWSAAGSGIRLYVYVNMAGKIRVLRNMIFDDEAGTSLPIGAWTHIAIVFTAETTCDLYVNGSFVETLTVAGVANVTDDINIGTYNDLDLGTYAFDGKMDEFRMYDRALSAQEVADTFNDLAAYAPWTGALVHSIRISNKSAPDATAFILTFAFHGSEVAADIEGVPFEAGINMPVGFSLASFKTAIIAAVQAKATELGITVAAADVDLPSYVQG